jgi:hypothetical protein
MKKQPKETMYAIRFRNNWMIHLGWTPTTKWHQRLCWSYYSRHPPKNVVKFASKKEVLEFKQEHHYIAGIQQSWAVEVKGDVGD